MSAEIQTFGFHDRHTFASLLIEADASIKVVQELLEHSTIITSMDIYGHISDKKKNRRWSNYIEIKRE